MQFSLREATERDLAAIAVIYAHHVLNGFGTFEEMPPDIAELDRRRADVLKQGLPYLVAETADRTILGYAYASFFRTRSAYRFCVEDSVYVAPGMIRRGIGRALLGELVARCADAGYRQIVAVIGDSGNSASLGLHAALDYQRVGTLPAVGFKLGRWIDCILMQRSLGEGSATAP
ncbi:MAG: Phosphinothricin acetyltransferase [Rhodospirillales bacterium]|nr:Phosphinothricin acetyltransferase [Rhodospirillales bacterium]